MCTVHQNMMVCASLGRRVWRSLTHVVEQVAASASCTNMCVSQAGCVGGVQRGCGMTTLLLVVGDTAAHSLNKVLFVTLRSEGSVCVFMCVRGGECDTPNDTPANGCVLVHRLREEPSVMTLTLVAGVVGVCISLPLLLSEIAIGVS